MKRFISLAVTALIIYSASAQRLTSSLNLRMNDNSFFKVIIDGKPVSDIANKATIYNLQPGCHFLEIYKAWNKYGTPSFLNVFSDEIVLSANTESWLTVYPEIHKVKLDDIRTLNGKDWMQDQTVILNPRTSTREHGKNHSKFFYPAPLRPLPMSNVDFIQLKNIIDRASFENTRISIFRQALNQNYFTTQQVCELMKLFWFEESKLEAAKMAYSKTIDTNNYYLVNNEFNYNNSVNSLADYLAMR